MRSLLIRYGVGRMLFGLTLLSILASVLITAALNLALAGSVGRVGLVTAIVAPALIVPLLGGYHIHLLHQIIQTEAQLLHFSATDPLTGVPNRRHFLELAGRELARSGRYGVPLSIAILDADAFKRVNDQHGHLVGDELLCGLAALCAQHVRESDLFARFGGEEFIVLFSEADAPEARRSAERLCGLIAAHAFPLTTGPLGVTVSIGVASYGPHGSTLNELLHHADQAMYAAKRAGGNCVRLAPPLPEQPEHSASALP